MLEVSFLVVPFVCTVGAGDVDDEAGDEDVPPNLVASGLVVEDKNPLAGDPFAAPSAFAAFVMSSLASV